MPLPETLYDVEEIIFNGETHGVVRMCDIEKYQVSLREFLITEVVKIYEQDGTLRIICKNHNFKTLFNMPYSQVCLKYY